MRISLASSSTFINETVLSGPMEEGENISSKESVQQVKSEAITLSIIVPTYNEDPTVAEIIRRIKAVDLSSQGVKKEIIVINDGSIDKTQEILKNIKGITILTHEKNKGKGAAIRTGLEKSSGDIYIIQDADLELNPAEYPTLIEPILKKESKVVYGSRYLNNSHVNWLSMLANTAVTQTANLVYNLRITDEATGYKVFTKEVLDNINLTCTRFEFCPEFTAKISKKGYKIKEVPVSYNYRKPEEGKKVGWKDGFEALWTLVKYRFVD
jgi:dolichol-phosphate mannosyltransferase